MTLRPGELPQFVHEDTPPDAYPGEVERPTFDEEIPEPLEGAETPGPPDHGPIGQKERWRMIARHYALGKTRKQIALSSGYTYIGVCRVLNYPWVQAEVARYRTSYEADIITQVKEAATDGVQVIHGIILDDTEKSTTRLDASKWAVEKTTGKAKQEVSVESGSFLQYMELLKQMQIRGEAIDVTPLQTAQIEGPADAVPADPWSNWLDTNT